MKFSRQCLLPLVLVCMAGCATAPQLGGDPGLEVYSGKALPQPDAGDLTAEARPYLVGPSDTLAVDVFGIPEMSGREVQVDESGRISFPPAGTVLVGGKSAGEIEQALALALRASYVRDPQVMVRIKEAKSQVVTIEGEVKNPGIYPVPGRLSLLGAMALSDGVSEFAKLDDVVIFRTVKGQRYAALYNLKAIRHGAQPDPEIYANDIIMVGDSPGRRMFKDILTLSPLITTPVILIDNLTR